MKLYGCGADVAVRRAGAAEASVVPVYLLLNYLCLIRCLKKDS